MMRFAVLAIALATTAAPALAAEAPAAHAGVMLRDANNLRIGRVDEVRADGSVMLIVDSRVVVVPASKLSMDDGKLTTSLTKQDIVASN